MNYDASLWLIFILLGLATTLPRATPPPASAAE